MPKFPKPFFRSARNCWYVQLGKEQVRLDPDEQAAFKLYHEPRTESFNYSTHSWPKATIARFRELMNLNERLVPLDGAESADPVEFKSSDEDSTRAHVRNWVDAIRNGGKPIEDARFGHHAALAVQRLNGQRVTRVGRERRIDQPLCAA